MNPFSERSIATLPDWLRGQVLGVEMWQFLSLALILVLGLVVRRIIQFIVKRRVKGLVESLGQSGVAHLVDAFASPGATLVMAGMLRVFYPQLRLPDEVEAALDVAVSVMVAFAIVWAAYKLVDVIADRMATKAAASDSKLDDQLVPLVRKGLKVTTVFAGFLFVLQNLHVNVGSLLAGLGIGGVAVALAAKDTIANFFGSIMIFIDRPFQIGDWVMVLGVEGIVEEVGFRSTRIRTFYNSLVTIPNAKFTEAAIDNYGMRQYRRIKTTLNVRLDTTPEQMQAFVEGIRSIIQANAYTRKDYYEIHMSGFGQHSLEVMLYFFVKVANWSEEMRERHNIFLEVIRLAKQLGVAFAYPTQTLYVDSLAEPGAPRELPSVPSEEAMTSVVHAFGPDGQLSRPSGPKLTDGYWAGPARHGS